MTGGIGCGKTTVAQMFAELGAAIVDTDDISRALTGKNGAAMPAIRAAFGAEFVDADGGLVRAKMRQLVFAEPAKKAQLEAILHPLIHTQVVAALAQMRAPYCLLVVPLLLETRHYLPLVSRVLVIDCPETDQITRTMTRSQLSEVDVRAIMRHQLTRASRFDHADDILLNDGSLTALRGEVEKLHLDYLLRASASHD
jgi:dephospho-CoA kinase